jgi:hypothetical protein
MSLILSGTDGLSDVDGSAATPAIRGTDANTGIFFPAADTIAFAEGGAECARFDSSGNLLVGSTSVPSPVANYKALVVGGTTGGIVDMGTTSTSYGRVSADSAGLGVSSLGAAPIIFRINAAEVSRIDSSGNLGVGVTPNTWYLNSTVYGAFQFGSGSLFYGRTVATANTVELGANFYLDAAGANRYLFSTQASKYGQYAGGHYWYSAASGTAGNSFTFTQAMTLDASGNLGIGVSTIATPSASRRGMQISNGTSGSVIFLSNFATEGDNPRIFSSITSQYDLGLVAGGSTGFINFYTNGTERMRIAAAGAVNVVGALSKGSGSFKIDHPLKSETHHLIHSFIEGPQADLIYRGKVNLVNGTATVNIDTASTMTEGTFVALCRDVQCFTTNESDWTAVRGSVVDNILSIQAQDSTSTASVSWMVIGERQDQHMYDTDWTDDNGKVIVEPLKEQPSTALESA